MPLLMPGRKEKPSPLTVRVKWRLNTTYVSPPLISIFFTISSTLSYAFSLLRATSSRSLTATLRVSAKFTINSLLGLGSGEEKKSVRQHRIFLSIRTEPLSELTSVVNLPRNRSRIHLPWKPSTSHWIRSRNPAVYKICGLK